MDFTATQDLIAALDERFLAETTWKASTRSGIPSWYGRLLTDLILVTGDEPIRYLSLNYVPLDEDAFDADLVVFTDEIVAFARFRGDNTGAVTPFGVTACARKSLTSFGVESVASALDTGTDTEWPGAVTFTVQYPDFDRILPLAASEWPGRDTETASLVACLRRDLIA